MRHRAMGVTWWDTAEESQYGTAAFKVEHEIFSEAMDKYGIEIIEMYIREHGSMTTYDDYGNELTSAKEIYYYTQWGTEDDMISEICKVICKNFNIDFEAKVKAEIEIKNQSRIKSNNENKISDFWKFISRNMKYNEKCRGITLDYNEKEFKALSVEKAEEYKNQFSKRFDCSFEKWQEEDNERKKQYRDRYQEEIEKIMKETGCEEYEAILNLNSFPGEEGIMEKIYKEIFD